MAQRRKFTFYDNKLNAEKTEKEDVTNSIETEITEQNNLFINDVRQDIKNEEPHEKSSTVTDLGKLVSKLENKIPKAMDVKYVPPNKINFHTDNKYPQDEIEKLADSILHNRLINPLEALYDIDEDKYTLESGERRFRALTLLIDKYKDWPDQESYEYKLYYNHVKAFEVYGYPVNVVLPKGELKEEDDIDSRIRVRIANEEQREFNAKRRAEAISELENLYKRKNEILAEKGEKQINVNDQISKDYNLNPRSVMYYKKTANLIPELQEEFGKDNLTLIESANIASLSEENQMQIFELIKAGKSKKEINELTKQLNVARIEAENAQKQVKQLKEELEKKERELETEKKSLDSKIGKIREELENELESNNPSKDIIDNLNKKLGKLENQQASLELEKIELQKDSVKKNNKIIALEEEITILKNQNSNKETPVIDVKGRELIKEEIILQNDFNDCIKSINNLLRTYKRYEKIYDVQIAEELNLTSMSDLKKKVNELSEKIKIR